MVARRRTRPKVDREQALQDRLDDMQAEYALTDEQWDQTLAFFENRCAYCDCSGELHKDHFVPYKLGGLYIWTNMVPACPDCNNQKGAQPPTVWLKDEPERYRRIASYLNSRAKELTWQINNQQETS